MNMNSPLRRNTEWSLVKSQSWFYPGVAIECYCIHQPWFDWSGTLIHILWECLDLPSIIYLVSHSCQHLFISSKTLTRQKNEWKRITGDTCHHVNICSITKCKSDSVVDISVGICMCIRWLLVMTSPGKTLHGSPTWPLQRWRPH